MQRKCEDLRAERHSLRSQRGTDNGTGEGAGVSGCHIREIMSDTGGWGVAKYTGKEKRVMQLIIRLSPS